MLVSLPFLGLMGVVLGSATSFSLPFLLMGLREGALARDGRVAWGTERTTLREGAVAREGRVACGTERTTLKEGAVAREVRVAWGTDYPFASLIYTLFRHTHPP